MSDVQKEKECTVDAVDSAASTALVDVTTTSDVNTTPNEDTTSDVNTTAESNSTENGDADSIMNNDNNNDSKETNTADILTRNPRVEKILALEAEIRRQNEQEKLRGRQIRQEQEYIDKMMNLSVEEALHETKEEQKYNKEFEEQIRNQVYHIHGLSDDKIEGMREYHNAWYQGAAFSLFFLSMILFILCGVLHGFHTELTLFMAFYTAIGGTLLTNGKHQSKVGGVLIKGVYLLLFPAMMIIFVCYELSLPSYDVLLPILTVAGAVILLVGVASYFAYDPYREDRKKRKKAEQYLRELEKTALKEIRSQEKAFDKQERKRKKQEEKEEKKKAQ